MVDASNSPPDFGSEITNRLTAEWLLSQLEPEEQEILWLHEVEDLTFAEIGTIIGLKYRGKELTGSAIRYHKDKIVDKLKQFRRAVGEE